MKKNITLLLFLSSTFLLTNCASIFNPRNQQVTITTVSNNAKVFVNDKYVNKGKTVKAALKRDTDVKQIRVEAEDYKPEYKVAFQKKKSGLIFLNFLLGPLFPIGFLYDYGPKSCNYEKLYNVEMRTKIAKKEANQKYVYLASTAFNVDKNNLKFSRTNYGTYTKSKKVKYRQTNEEDIRIDNTIFTDRLNKLLSQSGFTDTTNSVLRSKLNSVYLKASVDEVVLNEVIGKHTANAFEAFLVSELTINWEVYDIYNHLKLKKRIKAKSGEFSTDVYKKELCLKESIKDAIETSLCNFLSDKETQTLLNIETPTQINQPIITLQKPNQQVSNVEDAMQATVTILTDEGHGSGFFISKDGYLLTNYHVVAEKKMIKVTNQDGKTFPATVIRSNETMDLALLKIDAVLEKSFFLDENGTQDFIIGEEIFAVGTPTSTQLSQTLTRGIVSGKRKIDGEEWIQTDASVSFGNSGGPLITKQGKLIGVVNSKIVGIGVDGIAFGIPAKKIISYLELKY
jgi:serine protease Do